MKIDAKKRSKAIRSLKLIKASLSSTTALAHISEQSNDPFKILISTILSARTRDPVTEEASARLYAKFPDVYSLSKASEDEVAKLVKPVSFYQVKAPRIIKVAKIIAEKYQGKVPRSMEELLELPGVGRKTANCVLVYGFREPAIPVDVHVHRVSNRIGFVKTKNPEDTERALAEIYPKKYWLDVNESFVAFGQTICKPVVPRCFVCKLRTICDYYNTYVKSKESAD